MPVAQSLVGTEAVCDPLAGTEEVCDPLVMGHTLVLELLENAMEAMEREHHLHSFLKRSTRGKKPKRTLTDTVSEDQVLDRFEANGCSLLQLEVYKQVNNSSCGYYALHNAQLLMEAVTTDNADTSHNALLSAREPHVFWASYHKNFSSLRNNVDKMNTGFFPWDVETLSSGQMERSYMNFLLASCPRVTSLGGVRTFIALPELGVERLNDLEKVFARFQKEESVCHAFLIGSISHWITLFANKVNSKIELVLADSHNSKLLTSTEDELLAIACTKRHPDICMQSMHEVRNTINTIASCISGELHVRTHYMNKSVDNLSEGFLSVVVGNRCHRANLPVVDGCACYNHSADVTDIDANTHSNVTTPTTTTTVDNVDDKRTVHEGDTVEEQRPSKRARSPTNTSTTVDATSPPKPVCQCRGCQQARLQHWVDNFAPVAMLQRCHADQLVTAGGREYMSPQAIATLQTWVDTVRALLPAVRGSARAAAAAAAKKGGEKCACGEFKFAFDVARLRRVLTIFEGVIQGKYL